MARRHSSKIPLEEVYDTVGNKLPTWQKLFDTHYRRSRHGELEERLRESAANRVHRMDSSLDDYLCEMLYDFVQYYSWVAEESFEGPPWRFEMLARGFVDEYDLAGHVRAALEFRNELLEISYSDSSEIWQARNVDQTIAKLQHLWSNLVEEYAAYHSLQELPRLASHRSAGGKAKVERLGAEHKARDSALTAAANKLRDAGKEPRNIVSILAGQLQRQEIKFSNPTTSEEEPIGQLSKRQIRRILS